MADKKTKQTEVKKEKTFTKAEVDELVSAAVAKALKEQKPQVISATATPEMVTLMFVGKMAQNCVLSLGELGNINKEMGTIDVPKKDFLQKRDYKVDRYIEQKKVIVLNGLTEEEKQRFGIEYKDGELLTPTIFYKMLDIPTDEFCKIFESLCEHHQKTVATAFITAYDNGDKRVTLEKCKALNKISKKIDKDGLFSSILEDMGAKLAD